MKAHETKNKSHANKIESESMMLPSSHFTLSCAQQQIRGMAQVGNSSK